MRHTLTWRSPAERTASAQLPRDRQLPLLYGALSLANEVPAPVGEFVRDTKLALVEAALFMTQEPQTVKKLTALAGLSDPSEVRKLIHKLQELYERDGSSFQVEELGGGFQLLTRPEFHRWLARLQRFGSDLRLSTAARETLTIIAYRQPIMRADLEAVRGVQSGDVLRWLMEKGLVRIAGRHDSLGRPVLYGTTKRFLQVFGLKSLRELPRLEERLPDNRT